MGLYRDNGKTEGGIWELYRGYIGVIGIMERLRGGIWGLYRGYIRVMGRIEKNMETIIMELEEK